jgi:alpha-L-fucosidase
MTMNDTWGYKSYDDDWKDTRTLLHTLVDVASKGGNLLLNVGPRADGTLPAPSLSRLREMGEWMRVNGASIYGTSASPFPAQPAWGRFTRKPGVLYAHIFEWPKDSTLVIAGVKQRPQSLYLLADRKPLKSEVTPQGLVVHLPGAPPSSIDAVLALETSERFAAR